MIKRRQWLSFALVMAITVSTINLPLITKADEINEKYGMVDKDIFDEVSKSKEKQEKEGKVFIKIRYKRDDNKYDGWNFWVWEKGKEGKQVNFIGEDDKGKFAVIETTKNAKEIGFILRKSEKGNDWKENYFGGDKYIDLTKGDKEITINNVESEEKILDIKDLKRKIETVTARVHYFRFDGNYDNWNIMSWANGQEGKEFSFDGEDDYGKVCTMTYKNLENAYDIGFIIKKGQGEDKDLDVDRYLNLAYADDNGVIDIYLIQGDDKIYHNKKDVVKDKRVTSAKMDAINKISFKVNFKITKDIENKIEVKTFDKRLKGKVKIDEDRLGGTININESMNLNTKYKLEIEGYKALDITLGNIFNSKEFDQEFNYQGDLGAVYFKEKTKFILWSPTASEVKLALYGKNGHAMNEKAIEIVEMKKGEKGTWYIEKTGDLQGQYYNYLVTTNGIENEVTDPYAKGVGVNGIRSMVVNLEKTNPLGWEHDKKPALENPQDAVIYEMHIRDFSIDEKSGGSFKYKGKYKGVTEENTKLAGTDIKTGIDHLKELGVTHVHLMPTFDHRSIDETKLDEPQYNWGYDPQNFNAPEGSYSQDPYDGEMRIKEFKEMVKGLHDAGIGVVMDMVYNHTGASEDSHLNLAVPNYYYRQNDKGSFSNGSACGNETASERSMVRKMIIDSVLYWANEYHIDGFRFDLMGLHDIETMKQIRSELNKVDKSILMYGEGWTGGESPLPSDDAALKKNTIKYGKERIAAFSDDMRDGLKGSAFELKEKGFVNGEKDLEDTIKFGIVASTKHEDINYDKVNYSKEAWANEPYQTVNYASAHDNLTLWDKLQTTNPDISKDTLKKMNNMTATIVLTSQGIPFMQAGEEFLRTKTKEDGTFEDNSYNSPDSVNKLDWTRKQQYNDVFDYYKGLINLRKSHKAFRMNTTKEIQDNLSFLKAGKDFADKNLVAYIIDGKSVGDSWDKIAVVFNPNQEEAEVKLPGKDWTVVVDGDKAGTSKISTINGDNIKIPANASYVLVDNDSYNRNNEIDKPVDPKNPSKPDENNNSENNGSEIETGLENKLPQTGGISSSIYLFAGVVLCVGGYVLLKKGKKKQQK